MGARDDFFVNFGSNSPKFLTDLKRDLGAAKTEISSLESALAALAAKSRGVEVFGKTLRDAAKVAEGRPVVHGGGGGGGGGVDFTGIQDAVDEMGRDFLTMKRQLAGVIVDLARAADLNKSVFQKEDARARALEQGFWRDTASGRRAKAGDPGAVYEPGRSARAVAGQQINPALLTQMLNQQKAPSSAAPVRISDIGAAQVNIDLDSGLDRVVTGLREVRDEVRKLRQKGGVATSGTGSGKKSKASVAVEEVAQDAGSDLDKLRRQLVGVQVEQKVLASLRKQAGDAVSEELGEHAQMLKDRESGIRKQIATLEHESGVSRSDRRAANRGAAQKERGKDLPDVEWDRRREMAQRLDLALSPDAFRENVGKKTGQLQKSDLIDMAKQLTAMGFETRSAKSATVEQLTEGVLKGRQAMLAQYGANTPPELALGKRVQTDKLSSSIQELTRKLNLIPQEVQSVQDARESLRMAGLVGHQPLDPTKRVGAIAGLSQLPPGMVKGGQFDDANLVRHGAAAMGAEEAMRTLDKVWMDRAMRMAKDPDFNLRDIDINKEVKGGGDLATETRKQYYALRRATDNLDDLADQYSVNRRAMAKNAAFIGRAEERIATGRAKPNDEEKLAAARAQQPDLLKAQKKVDAEFEKLFKVLPSLRNLLESPEFQRGLESRQQSRKAEREAAEARRLEVLANPPSIRTDVRDAMGMGIINSRLAAGTKDTYVRDIADATYNRDKDRFDFRDPDSRKSDGSKRWGKDEHVALDQVNKYWTNFSATHRRMAKAVADGMDEEGLARIAKREENRATKFLNALHGLFGMSRPIENLIGRQASNPKNAEADARRIAETRALHEADRPSGKASTAEEMLATRLEFYAAAVAERAAAEKKATAQATQTAKVEAKHQQALKERTDALGDAEAAALRAAKADLDIARAERAAVGPTKYSGTPLTQDGILELLKGAERYRDEKLPGRKDSMETYATRDDSERDLAGSYKNARLRDEYGYDMYEKFQHQPMREGGGNAAPVDAVRRARPFGPQREHESRSAEQAELDANAERAREVTAREADARQRVTAILGAEATEVELARKKARELARARDKAKAAVDAEAQNIKDVTVGRARGLVESREASLREIERVGGSDEDVALRKGKLDEARNELARLERIDPQDLIKALQTAVDTATSEVKKGTQQVKAKAASKATATPTVDTAELAAKKEIKAAALALAKELREAKKDISAANKAKDSAALATAQARRDAALAHPDYLDKDQRSSLNKEIFAMQRAGGSSGSGGGDGTPPAPPSGGDGGDPGDNNILRQILNAVNQVNTTLKGGLRFTGKVTVDPKTGEATTAPRERKPVPEGTVRRAPGETREMAIARAAQQREAAELRHEERADQLGKQRERRTARLRASDVAQEHGKLRLQTATAALNAEAVKELAILEKLQKEGKDAAVVAHQQAKALHAVERSLAANIPNSSSAQRQVMGREVMGLGTAAEYGAVRQSAQGIFGQLPRTAQQAGEEARDGLAGALFGDKGFWGRIMGSTGAFIIRNFAAGAVFGITTALQDVIYQGIITESTWIRVSDALEQTGRSAGSLRTDLQEISSSYGVALNDVYMTAAGLTGVFEDMGDLASATRVVAQLQAISMGALTAQESMGVLSSITGAYASELRAGADGLNQVADVLTVVQNTIGTNVEVTAEGVGALSGLAKQLKIPFEEMSVYVAQIAKLTNQTGAAAGEQFSRILASMQGGRGRAAIAEALPGTGIEGLLASGEYGAAIQGLMKQWNGLSETQQRNLSVTIAGQRQARAFAALMNDTEKTLEASARAHNANGEAQKRSEAIANTLNGQLTRLSTNFQNLAQNLVRTGLLNFFGLLLRVTNEALAAINKVFSVVNDVADSNPLLKMFKDWAAGLLGFILTLKLAQVAWRGFSASLRQVRAGDGAMGAGLNAMAARQAVPGAVPGAVGPGMRAGWAQGAVNVQGSLKDRAAMLRERAADQTQLRRMQANPMLALASGNDPKEIAQANAASKARTAALNAEARATSLASRGAQGFGKGMGALAAVGGGLGLALTGAAIAGGMLVSQLKEQKELQEELAKLNERYSPSGVRYKPGEEKDPYVGPYDDMADKIRKDRKLGVGSLIDFGLQDVYKQSLDMIKNPIQSRKDMAADAESLDLGKFNFVKKFTPDSIESMAARNLEWQGYLDDTLQATLDDLRGQTNAAIRDLTSGKEFKDKYPMDAREQQALAASVDSAGEFRVEKYGVAMREDLNKERASLIKQFEDGKIEEGQFSAAMAGIEELEVAINDAIAAELMLARGFAERDTLSMDMIKNIEELRPFLQQIQGKGMMTPEIMRMLDDLNRDTGVPETSKAGKIMARLGDGNLSKVQALKADRKLMEEELKNARAKYDAAVDPTGDVAADPDQVEEYANTIKTLLSQMSTRTEEIIAAAVNAATSIAQVAANSGKFGQSQEAIQSALDTLRSERAKLGPVSPEVDAQLDMQESDLYSKQAEYAAQGQNGRLELSKARSQSSQYDAQMEAQITQNTYRAMQAANATAQAAGQQGIPVQQLRAAKIAWIQAEQALASIAQQANIAAMTLAAAGLWNGIASAQAQEGIAMQQYKDAVKNFGAGSIEALNAQAAVVGAQKNTTSTLDQVAQATNDAALAAIPQGNGVAVAQKGVQNAQAALAAAKKYGTNSVEYQGALAQLYSAQQQVNSATAAVASAQVGVAIAIADAAGNTVQSAILQLRAARITMSTALKNSGGAMSAEVLQARAGVISANAAVRDAKLQDNLDTIDFNLEMGRITQSSAITALQEILKTKDLTEQQRRSLMLQIKGMKEELSGSPWNFGDIKLPKPYLMKRYIEEMKEGNTRRVDGMLKDISSQNLHPNKGSQGPMQYNDHRVIELQVNGGNLAEVRRVVEDVVGKPARTRTVAPRRGRR